MLSTQDNEYLTHIGPGTPMGSFLREYWMPAMLSQELPGPDAPPVRVLLLGEKLIGFRDTSGRVGLVDHLCPHRGAGMFFGRNEEDGLRCVYHGWKFDVEGRCVDMPSEPPESNFKNKVSIKAYPCTERGGIVWAYMGSRAVPPPLPGIEATLAPEGAYRVSVSMRECNWLQALEGDIDTVHAAILHGGHNEPEDFVEGTFNFYEVNQRSARFVAVDTDFGCMYGAYRPAGAGRNYWRIGQFLFPIWTQPPPGLLGHKILSTCWVPLDDHHTLTYTVSVPERSAYGSSSRSRQNQVELQPNTSDWLGRFRTADNFDNDFGMDRTAQRETLSYVGMPNGTAEDHSVQASMGPILDRTIEHLGTTDLMIIQVRRRLQQAAEAWNEHKATPPALDHPELYGVRCGGIILDEDADWLRSIQEYLPAFVDHPELDVAVVGGTKPRGVKRSPKP